MEKFQYHLEGELSLLHRDLKNQTYVHGGYRTFTVFDPKKREICVSSLRDRVVHRMLYEYLVPIFDPTFSYDVWSCRKGKGLQGAIDRVQSFRRSYPDAWIFRADVHKFFDHVNQGRLKELIRRKITDTQTLHLLDTVIDSYEVPRASSLQENDRKMENSLTPHYSFANIQSTEHRAQSTEHRGIPIGNLTSQIFANIYLGELDRFVQHKIKPLAYMRYGDDFLVFMEIEESCIQAKESIEGFLKNDLSLSLHAKRNLILSPKTALRFLGVELFVNGRRLLKNNRKKVIEKMNKVNAGSYYGVVKKNDLGFMKKFLWRSIL